MGGEIRLEPDERSYPRTWVLLEVVDREPRLLGREVVDLSPGAIELRHAARELRSFAEERERWVRLGEKPAVPALPSGHRRDLSFGPRLAYCVERDERRHIHGGNPFRHLVVHFRSRIVTPATSAEIGLYFYGRRPAVFGYTGPDSVHGFIGFGWEPLEGEDVRWLLRRERKGGG